MTATDGRRPGLYPARSCFVLSAAPKLPPVNVSAAVPELRWRPDALHAAPPTLRQRFESSSFQSWVSAFLAMEGASLAGEIEWVEEVERMAAALPPGTRADRLQEWVELMHDVLSGHFEDPERARTVALGFGSDLLALLRVEILASVARHLPLGHPSGTEIAAEARQTALAAGATGLAEWVDLVVDSSSSAS